MNRAGAIAEFLSRLSDGDEVAWGILIGFLILAVISGLIVLKVHYSLKREDEEQARRYGRRPRK